MKKVMRIAAMFAAAGMICAAMPVQPASAQTWTLVGEETESFVQDMIPVNDKGMFNFGKEDIEYQVYLQPYTNYHDEEVRDPTTGEVKTERIYTERCRVNLIKPLKDTLWFVLRPDKPNAEAQMLEILERYYSGISESFTQRKPNEYASLSPQFYILNDGTSSGPHKYELLDLTESAGSQKRSDSIMHDLAEAGLITEFYTWGQGAYCQQFFGWLGYAEDGFDKEKIERYLTEHAPDCTVAEHIHEAAFPDTVLTWKDYSLIPDESMSYAEQFALVADIYEATGIRPSIWSFEDIQEAFGQNALAITGDVTLDCTVDVSDAVLLARFCTEDSTAVITDQGKQNADVNDSGNIDLDDVTAILRKIAKLD